MFISFIFSSCHNPQPKEMAMDPGVGSTTATSRENNQNHELITPGDSSGAAHLSPLVIGGQTIFMNPGFHRHLEDMIQRSVDIRVRELFQELSPYINLPPRLLPDPNIQSRYQLKFINKVKDPTFTTNLVRDENGDPIKVAIYPPSIISPGNSLSSAKVRITVLDAEFWRNRVNWSKNEFIQSVLREREGKGPILTGRSLTIQLVNGVGTFENIVFNDNSRWTKSGFRLGVMVEVEGEEGYINGERVQEGVGDHFQVRDRRGQASQKPDRLKLTHKVQSLKKVGKDRASFLQKKNINTVEDFLKLYYNDEPALREILGIKSESDKGWMSMIEHATQCADEFYAKYNALNNSSQPQQALVYTNEGPRVVSSGSSEPNHFQDDINGGDMAAINRQRFPIYDIPSMNLSNEYISSSSWEHMVETQPVPPRTPDRTRDSRTRYYPRS